MIRVSPKQTSVLLCALVVSLSGCGESFKPLAPLAQQIEAKFGAPTLSIESRTLLIHLKADQFNLEALQGAGVNLQETAAYRFAADVASFAKLHYEDAGKLVNFVVVLNQQINNINRIDFKFTFSAASLQ